MAPLTSFRVTVSNLKATNLPGMDVGGTSDPFVKVRRHRRHSAWPPPAAGG